MLGDKCPFLAGIRWTHIGDSMQITLVPDSSIGSVPAGLTAAVEAAAAIYEQDFPGNYNVNISYGWGTFDNAPSDVLTNTGSGVYSLGGGGSSTPVSYSQLKSWLTANAASSAQIAAVASLHASSASFPGDADTFFVSSAEEKALGVFRGDGSAIDGSIGFNIGDASSPADWEPAALTEIAHALGWDSIAQGGSFPDVADLFRYSSPGQYGWTSGQSAYFSIDGGKTDLADFATSFDQTLFSDLPTNDPLRVPFTSAATTLTSFDIEALSVIGFGAANVVSPRPHRFNAGGNSPDALLQKNDGSVAIWQMNGTNLTGGPVADPGPTWTAPSERGIFNGDGHSDILLQSNDGSVAVWEMNGTSVTSGAVVADPGPSWHALGTGDFNGDGLSDILLQNNDGSVAIWEMNGTSVVGSAVVADPGPT
jgi:FG-GAP-like repeat